MIAQDALSVLPPEMREAFTPHISSLLAGVEQPDFFRIVSHKIPIISLRGTPPPPKSGASNALKQFATNAQEMLRLGRDLWDVLFVVGQATHFVQDLNQPLHAGWGETWSEHNEIEARMLYRSWQKEHSYGGFRLVRDYSCFAYEIAQNSSQHTRTLFFDRDITRVTTILPHLVDEGNGPNDSIVLRRATGRQVYARPFGSSARHSHGSIRLL